jgi:hypothetical protein
MRALDLALARSDERAQLAALGYAFVSRRSSASSASCMLVSKHGLDDVLVTGQATV